MLALIEDGQVKEYPYTVAQLRAAHRGTSFAAEPSAESLAGFGVYPVAETEPPETAPGEATEEAAPALIDGVWTQQWAIRERTPQELQSAKLAKWELAKAKRDRAVEGGCTVPGIGSFDTDLVSRTNITGAVAAAILTAQTGQVFSATWKLADNRVATLSGAQIIAAGMAIVQRMQAVHAHAQAIGMAIQAAISFDELAAIDIEGWPE